MKIRWLVWRSTAGSRACGSSSCGARRAGSGRNKLDVRPSEAEQGDRENRSTATIHAHTRHWLVGDGFTVQANMMARDTVWGAMAAAYESGSGSLARRLLAALDAAEAEGGDFRGPQSAAILVVEGEPTGFAWKGRVSNLRVDDDEDPLGELRRLLDLEEDYRAERPGHLRENAQHWMAAEEAAKAGAPERARELLQPLFDLHPNWRDAVRAAGEYGEFPGWEQVLE